MTTAAKVKLKPKLRFRVWREAEQRWVSDRELARIALWDRITGRGKPRNREG